MPPPMYAAPKTDKIALLLSGGLDSCILLADLLQRGIEVLPIYIDSGLAWQDAELNSLRRFLAAMEDSAAVPLTVLEVPLGDVYGEHWSVTGEGVPDSHSDDEAVYLPGRNALLLVKSALYCQSRGIEHLAIGLLGTSPFRDAKPDFFAHFMTAMNLALGASLRIHRPFAGASKRLVMQLGRDLPLQWTFSCMAPQGELHCGRCNKCAERRAAFRAAELRDPTEYASPRPAECH